MPDTQAPDPFSILANQPVQMPNLQQAPAVQPNLAPQPVKGHNAKVPGVYSLIKDLVSPPTQVQVNHDTKMAETRPVSRLDVFENFLGNFINSLGQGFANQGHGPGSFGRGFGAAVQAPLVRQSQEQQLAQQAGQIQQQQAQTELLQRNAQMIDTPVGPMSMAAWMKIAPSYFGGQARIGAAQVNKRFQVTPTGLYDTQANKFIPGTGQGVPVTADIAKDYGLPDSFIGKPMKITDLAALERGQAFQNTPVQTSQGPVVANKKTGIATPVTVNGKPVGPSQQAGAYWNAVYGVTPVSNPETGNPQYVSRINAPGMAPTTGALEMFKGKQGLETFKTALNKMNDSMDALADPTQRALIAQTLRGIGTNHDPGVVSALIGNAVSSGLSEKSADLVAATLQAREFIGANRQFAGNFRGSEPLYQRMVSNVAGPQNSPELNRKLIAQDLAATEKIEQGIKGFQGGSNANKPSNVPKSGDKVKSLVDKYGGS